MAIVQPIRLKKRKQFVLVSDQGAKHVASGLILQALPNHTDDVRIGFTVTKRVGCAVVRNRVRRRLREVVRLSPDIADMKGYDLVVIGRQSTLDRPFRKLAQDLAYVLHCARDKSSMPLTACPPKTTEEEKLIEAVRAVLSASGSSEGTR